MKRLPLVLSLALFASCATQASKPSPGPEFESGMIRLGGGLVLASGSPGLLDGKSSGGQVSGGYLFTDNMEAGVRFSMDSVDSTPENIDLSMFSLYGRAYGQVYGPIRPWFELGVGTGTSETTSFQGDTSEVHFGLGFVHFFSEDWSVDVSFDQTFYHQQDGGADNAALRAGVGVSYWM